MDKSCMPAVPLESQCRENSLPEAMQRSLKIHWCGCVLLTPTSTSSPILRVALNSVQVDIARISLKNLL